MLVKTDSSGSSEGLQRLLKRMAGYDGVESLMVLACDRNGFTPAQIDPILQSLKLPLFGGIFPALLFSGQKLELGTIVIGLPVPTQVHLVNGLSSQEDFDDCLDAGAPAFIDAKTMFVFVDAFARCIGAFIDSLFNVFGLELNYLGGGAGSMTMVSKPCLMTNNGLVADAAVLAGLDAHSGVGVSHGWESIKGPYKVTEAQHNCIKTLDWQPAFDVYRQVVETHSGRCFDAHPFFDLAKAFPFGITKMEAERVVRDPCMAGQNGELICVGELAEGAFVDILHGNAGTLIQAAESAFWQSAESYPLNRDRSLTFFIDCISRILFLEDRFKDEIAAVSRHAKTMAGICSIGEIASSGNDYLEFYNKTAVVGHIGIE